ncbi:uncharacterized protein LOC131208091 [Anopheles bellator]|uniref:uncharacterized protein LOC131208091 n=1 Tax=Anopheles bellator TaxID=139047 RepID=UPI002648C8A3|nr:uncharacterized protein LOC131208091 [Anopheles bellator]
MKPSLCCTYCTLFLVFLVSSCTLFIIVASDALKPTIDKSERQHDLHSHSQDARTGSNPGDPVAGTNAVVNVASFTETSSEVAGRKAALRGKPNSVLHSESSMVHSNAKITKPLKRPSHGRREKNTLKKNILIEKPNLHGEPPDLKDVIFLETISKNVGITNSGLQDIPGPQSVVTLVDHQRRELSNIENKLEENLEATLKNLSHNIHTVPVQQTVVPVLQHGETEQRELPTDASNRTLEQANGTEFFTETSDGDGSTRTPEQPSLVLVPVDGGTHVPFVQDAFHEDVASDGEQVLPDADSPEMGEAGGAALKAHEVNLTEENPMPVFSEWAEKQMAEAEKKKQLGEVVNASLMRKGTKPTGSKTGGPLKPRAKNYAAPECGAKIIASNPEAQSTGSVLTAPKDEYLLNPCTSKIWFVVELCEPVQAERIELANFELFSSSPKDFSVSVSNRFPTRDWANVGQFTAKDERDVQSFQLHPHLFGKFVRVEILSHYNQEHFCPVSLFRVYGTSEFEAFETDNTPMVPDDDDEQGDEFIETADVAEDDPLPADGQAGAPTVPNANHDERNVETGTQPSGTERQRTATSDKHDKDTNRKGKPSNPNNILKSAGEVVLNMVKKAAEVLGKSGPETNASSNPGSAGTVREVVLPTAPTNCITLAYTIRCVNCSDHFRTRLESTMNCKHNLLTSLLGVASIGHSFDRAQHFLCANVLGFNLPPAEGFGTEEEVCVNMSHSVLNLLLDELVASFCNIVAFDRKLLPVISSVLSSAMDAVEEDPPKDRAVAGDNPYSDASSSLKGDLEKGESPLHQQHHPSAGSGIEQPVVEKHEPIIEDQERRVSDCGEPKVSSYEEPEKDDVNMFNIASETPKVSSGDERQSSTGEGDAGLPVDGQQKQQQQEKEEAGTTQTWETGMDDGAIETGPSGSGKEGTLEGTFNLPATVAPTGPAKVQPESVFLRLSNRIKALERNMSLSGQYLEELSRRYRKQVEELQHSYAKTLHEIEEQTRRARESEASLREVNNQLRQDLANFRSTVIDWRNVAFAVTVAIMVMLLALLALVRSLIVNGHGRMTIPQPAPIPQSVLDRELAQVGLDAKPIRGRMLRRKSIDGMPVASSNCVVGGGSGSGSGVILINDESLLGSTTRSPTRLRQKRPSEEALNISGTYVNLLIDDDVEKPLGQRSSANMLLANAPTGERKKGKHKHRKVSAPSMMTGSSTPVSGSDGNFRHEPPRRSISMLEPHERGDHARTSANGGGTREPPEVDGNRIEELPLLEDNDEFIIPTASDLSYDEFMPGALCKADAVDNESKVEDGAVVVEIADLSEHPMSALEAKKLSKTRRLSSPAFFKTSILRASIGKKRSSKTSSVSSSSEDGRRSSKKSTNSSHSAGSSSHTSSSSNSSNISSNNTTASSEESAMKQASEGLLEKGGKSNGNGISSGGWEWYRLKQKKNGISPPSSSQDAPTSSGEPGRLKGRAESLDESVYNGSSATDSRKLSVSFNGELPPVNGGGLERKASGSRGSIRRLFRRVF